MVNGSNVSWATKKVPEIHVGSDGRRFVLHGAYNAQNFSFVSQEHEIADYFPIILQTLLNTGGHASNVGCNWGGISAVSRFHHVAGVWVACVGSGGSATAGWSCGGASWPLWWDKCNVIFFFFLLLMWHVFNHKTVLSWKGPTRIMPVMGI